MGTDVDSSDTDLWENTERYLTWIKASDKLTRKRTLSTILTQVESLPRLNEKQSIETPNTDPLLDSDDENENPKVKVISSAKCKIQYTGDPCEDVKNLMHPLLTCLSDPVEKCRELAYETLTRLSERLNVATWANYLTSVCPILVTRLAQQELIESSEEVRLLALNFITALVKIFTRGPHKDKEKRHLIPYLEDLTMILFVTIRDPYHSVRIISCELASECAQQMPQPFSQYSEKLIPSLVFTIAHQQYRVRKAAVQSIGDVMLYGGHKCIEDVFLPLIQRMSDGSPNVRKTVIQVVGQWSIEYSERYSFFHRFIPVILTGICDENPDVSNLSNELWNKIGDNYLQENKNEFKDQIDFPIVPSHFPKHVTRKNLGCRLLAWNNAAKLVPGITHDICDWSDDNRIKSAQLLYNLILNCEQKITIHSQAIVRCMFKSVFDESSVVSQYVHKSANLLAHFVPLSTTWPIIEDAIKLATKPACILAVASSILKGSDPDDLITMADEITNFLADENLCQTFDQKTHTWMVRCCDVFLNKNLSGDKLFEILVTVLAMSKDENTQHDVLDCLNQMQVNKQLEHFEDLLSDYSGPILERVKNSETQWNALSPEKLIFATLLSHGGCFVEKHIDTVLEILLKQLQPDNDAEVRLKIFTLLSEALSSTFSTDWLEVNHRKEKFSFFVTHIIEDVLSPNLVWKAGKTASALRTSALSCLLSIINSKLITNGTETAPKIVSSVLSLVDDGSQLTRLVAIQCLAKIPQLCQNQVPAELINKTYPDLLKRLDDENMDVRLCTCLALNELFRQRAQDYDISVYKAHLEFIINTLVVHLDDDDNDMQMAVNEVMMTMGQIMPELVVSTCQKFKDKHRSPVYCQALIDKYESH